MTSMWAAQWFSKKHPKPLDEILKHKEHNKEMTDEQMYSVVKALNNAIGGEVNGSR